MRTVVSRGEDTAKGKAMDQSGAEQKLRGQKRGQRARIDVELSEKERDESGPTLRNGRRLTRRTTTRDDQGARKRTVAPHGGGLAKGDQRSDDGVSDKWRGVESVLRTGVHP